MNELGANKGAIPPHLPAFDDFPYLAIRLGPAFFHLLVLPRHCAIDGLRTIARCQAQANDLRVCLALNHREGIYYRPDGSESLPSLVPRGGIVTCGILRLPIVLVASEELVARQWSLRNYVADHNPGGYAYGDLTKGGRDATPQEARHLAGFQVSGAPNGLAKCERCRGWRGECLDPSPYFKGKVMRVHCLCENHNTCAWCGQRLYERKLDANYYSEKDGHIWHVPGFLALKHRCGGGGQWKA